MSFVPATIGSWKICTAPICSMCKITCASFGLFLSHAPPPAPCPANGAQEMWVLGLVLARPVFGGRENLWSPVLFAYLQGDPHADRVVGLCHSAASILRGTTISRMTPAMPSRRMSTSSPALVTVTRRTRSCMMEGCSAGKSCDKWALNSCRAAMASSFTGYESGPSYSPRTQNHPSQMTGITKRPLMKSKKVVKQKKVHSPFPRWPMRHAAGQGKHNCAQRHTWKNHQHFRTIRSQSNRAGYLV